MPVDPAAAGYTQPRVPFSGNHHPHQAPGPRQVLGIGAFLAVSWTWCIGMFLPVLLARDLGPLSFLVFAIPNCVGAALMGWVMRRPGASAEFIKRHTAACVWFSRITIAFHAFFLMWMVQLHGAAIPVIAGFIVNLVLNLVSSGRGWPGWSTAALTYGVSIACAVTLTLSGALAVPPHGAPLLAAADLAWLAPVCVFGFLFCPYLDLSFHAARKLLPEPWGTRSFVAGFCGLFLIMIVLTLAYSGALLRVEASMGLHAPAGGRFAQQFGTAALAALFVHVSTQAAFTTHLHLGMISQTLSGLRWKVDPASLLSLVIPMILGILTPWLPAVGGRFAAVPGPMSGGEAIYRSFMAFYGLVFPAYIWICVLPSPDRSPSRLQRLALAASVGIALPMFYMGFIERQTWWLAPGLGVVLAARLLTRRPPTPVAA